MALSALLRGRLVPERSRWQQRARTPVRVVAGLAGVVGVTVAVGWLAQLEPVLRAGAAGNAMNLASALCVGVLAGGHLAGPRGVRRALFVAVLLASVAYLTEDVLGVAWWIDRLAGDAGSGAAHAGRPAEATLVCLGLLAAAGITLDLGRRAATQALGGTATMTGLLTAYGHLYAVGAVSGAHPSVAMAPITAMSVLLLGAATLLSVPQGMLQWICFGRDTGAALQRILLPVALVLLPTGGWLRVKGEEEGLYDSHLGSALLVILVAGFLTAVSYRVGLTALRMDRERDMLLAELHRVNADLEDRVRVRSHQLDRQRTKLTLFEERDRIARDLHDRVIQRVFAAGLQLSSLSRIVRRQAEPHGAPGAEVAESLDLVAIELDLAIRELRNSIFELTSVDDQEDLEQVVHDLAARASRILGFSPRVAVRGATTGLRQDLVAQVASVIQEGLSNVARHARAGAAELVVMAADGELEVRLSDDGRGLPDPLPRSSGISNLVARAQDLGGTATWTDNVPAGTVFRWRVPLAPAPDVAGSATPAVLGLPVTAPA